jgi:hypothetical protein
MKLINRGAESAKNDTQEIVESLQAERSAMLGQVRDLQLAVRLLLQAETQRLAQKGRDDPRVAALALQQTTLRDRIAVLDTELEVAAIRTPTVTRTDTLIHGRIADDAHRAAGKLTVELLHADGRGVEGVPPVQTDAAGYYAFVLDPNATANLPAGEKLSVAVRSGENTVVPGATAGFAFTRGSVAVKDVALTDAELQRLKLRGDRARGSNAGVQGTPAATGAGAASPSPPQAEGKLKPAAPSRSRKKA